MRWLVVLLNLRILGNLLVTIHVSCKFRNQSVQSVWIGSSACSASTTEQQLCWGCTVTLTHSVSKVQQRQLDVAVIDDVLHRPNGSLNLPVALGISRTARDMLKVPSLRELSELAARELWTIVRHHYFGHSMTHDLIASITHFVHVLELSRISSKKLEK